MFSRGVTRMDGMFDDRQQPNRLIGDIFVALPKGYLRKPVRYCRKCTSGDGNYQSWERIQVPLVIQLVNIYEFSLVD